MPKKIIIVLLTFFTIYLIFGNMVLLSQKKIEYENFINLLNENKVKQVSITDEVIKGIYLEDGHKILFSTIYPHDTSLYEVITLIREKGVVIVPSKSTYILSVEGFMRNLIVFLPSFLILAVLMVILILNVLIYKKLKK